MSTFIKIIFSLIVVVGAGYFSYRALLKIWTTPKIDPKLTAREVIKKFDGGLDSFSKTIKEKF